MFFPQISFLFGNIKTRTSLYNYLPYERHLAYLYVRLDRPVDPWGPSLASLVVPQANEPLVGDPPPMPPITFRVKEAFKWSNLIYTNATYAVDGVSLACLIHVCRYNRSKEGGDAWHEFANIYSCFHFRINPSYAITLMCLNAQDTFTPILARVFSEISMTTRSVSAYEAFHIWRVQLSFPSWYWIPTWVI